MFTFVCSQVWSLLKHIAKRREKREKKRNAVQQSSIISFPHDTPMLNDGYSDFESKNSRESGGVLACRVLTTFILCAIIACGVCWCLVPEFQNYSYSTKETCSVIQAIDNNASCLTHVYRGHIFTVDVSTEPDSSSSDSSSFSGVEGSLEYCMIPPFNDTEVPCWLNSRSGVLFSSVPPFPWCGIAILFVLVCLTVMSFIMTIRSIIMRNTTETEKETPASVNASPVDYGTYTQSDEIVKL